MSETTPPAGQPLDRIEDLQIEQELQDSYLTYAMSTIMDRALPDVRDGLKPSQRRILVAMHDLNLTPGRKHIKCAKIAGDTSGNYHPHGEAVIYPTLVRMAQEWSMRYQLIDGQGNFGSTDGDPPAAMRYTEARMAGPTVDMLQDIDLDTVDFQANYDERLQEPMVLPSKFPNLLVNGSTGIAVGMACNLLPHNLREICDAIVAVIDNPEIQINELLNIVPGPDFPTGGIICGRDGIVDGYTAGRGRITLRAKVHVEEPPKGSNKAQVIIDELPYGVIRKDILEQIAAAVKDDRIRDVSDANDHSGRKYKCRMVVDLKRDADPNVVINQLYQFTSCQITVSMINIALVNRQPRTMGLKELIQHFIEHRREVITRRTKFLLKKAQQREHIVTGLMLAQLDIDEVIKIIRSSKTREEAITRLTTHHFQVGALWGPRVNELPEDLAPDFAKTPLYHRLQGAMTNTATTITLTRTQAEAIGRLQLIQLVGLEFVALVKEYVDLRREIENYEAILASNEVLMDEIREDMIEIREKYGDDRRTEITGAVSDLNMEALIAKEDVVVTVSHEGYIKRLPTTTYRAQGRGGRGIKGTESREGDFVEHLFIANTHDHLLFFTNTGRVYERRVYDVPEMSRTSQGRAIANLLELQQGEKMTNTLAIQDFEKGEQYLMFATAKGTVKKTALSAYGNIRQNGIIAISLEEGDSLIGVQVTSGKDHVMLCTRSGLAVRFEETDVRAMGRPAGGVTGVRFKREGDEVVDMIVVPEGRNEGFKVLTGCANGYGKRTPLEDYPVKGRGTRGVINIDATERNGDVVGAKLVGDLDELMLITSKGILIRTGVAEIRETGRNAAGVKLIRIDEGDKLVAMARVDKEDEAEQPEAPPSTAPEAPPEEPKPQ
jgi:DNA gyrase subunit A